MRTKTIPCLLLVVAALPAQEGASPRPADTRYRELTEKVDAAVTAWREEQLAAARKAAEAAERARERGENPPAIPAMSMMPPFERFVPEFRAAADEYAGTDGAVPFLLWIATWAGGRPEELRAAVATLMQDHFASEQLVALPPVLGRAARVIGEAEAGAMLDRLAADSPHAGVRAEALFARSAPELAKAALGSETYERAKAELLKAADITPDEDLKGRIRGAVAGREQLAKGGIAPDIEGVDLDGVAFKLSDYAGKVVLLDFWGDW